VLLGLFGCKTDTKFTAITGKSQVALKVATSVFKEGVAVLNDSHEIPYNCPLNLTASSIKSGLKFTSYFNIDVQKMIPTIGDLKPRYILLKQKNEQIIYGIKQGDTLAFTLIDFPK